MIENKEIKKKRKYVMVINKKRSIRAEKEEIDLLKKILLNIL